MYRNIEALANADLDSRPRRGDRKQALILAELAAPAELFRSPDQEAYARIPVHAHFEVWPVRSKEFRNWLMHRFYRQEEKPPGAQAVQEALDALEARAMYEGPTCQVFIRVAEKDGAIYIDLANQAWEAVEVTTEGWQVVVNPPVRFRRARGVAALPYPVQGGSLNDLRSFVNLRDEGSWHLLAAWLVGAVRPNGPYPVLVLQGEQGSAKSTLARVVRAVIDPSLSPLRTMPQDERDLMIAATNAWILSFDNLSGLRPWQSDGICRLSTGGGFAIRALYTDSEEIIFDAQRPVILNGIDDVATRQDLIDRALVLTLPPIPDDARRAETEFWTAFELARPRIFGALLNAVRSVLQNLPHVSLPRKPRMADFAEWVTAAQPALGWPDGAFLEAYQGNREEAIELALEATPVAQAVREFMEARGEWTGTATELLDTLTDRLKDNQKKAAGWPQAPQTLSRQLRRASTALRAVGLDVEFDRKPHTRWRRIRIQKAGHDRGPAVPTVPLPGIPATDLSDGAVKEGDDPGTTALTGTDQQVGSAPVEAGIQETGDDGDAGTEQIPPFSSVTLRGPTGQASSDSERKNEGDDSCNNCGAFAWCWKDGAMICANCRLPAVVTDGWLDVNDPQGPDGGQEDDHGPAS